MCTRIFNSLNQEEPMTGRNFDWHYPLNTFLYSQPKGIKRVGGDINVGNSECIIWQAQYASTCTYLGSDNLGLAAIDGINEKGLAVNGLEDLLAHFPNIFSKQELLSDFPLLLSKSIEEDRLEFIAEHDIPNQSKLLSSLRWVQFVLDNFDSVKSAAQYFRDNEQNLFIYSGDVPDGHEKKTKTKLHLTLSDPSGNSAIIEIRGKGFSVNESANYNVATVTPRYEVQQLLMQYWLEKWEKPAGVAGLHVYDVPGGTATHQRFARANYYYKFSNASADKQGVLSQTRALMATCATPIGLNLKQDNSQETIPSANTLWCSVSEHNSNRYHLINTETLTHQWLDLEFNEAVCQRVLLIKTDPNISEPLALKPGALNQHLTACPAPFSAV
ncbi:linear amide C-N hydrolase [Catenovulum sediminis]|uniref:Linear amide C-N hydrolase n=1 Tax=Catenovulum sediminis TaxID=1740262 RepID=A0ABV1RFB0_9ALTE